MSSTEPRATSLYPALLAAMREFNPVVKNKQNPHLKNFYADLGAVLEAVAEPLANHGLLITQRFDHEQGSPILITEIIHAESGQALTSTLPIASKDPSDPQKLGGAITYARRYSLVALLSLTAEDDDGNAASKPAPPPRKQWSGAERMAYAQQHGKDPVTNDAPRWGAIEDAIADDAARAAAAQAPRPAPASNGTPAPAAKPAPDDDTLLAIIRNDQRDPDKRVAALHAYYDRSTVIMQLNQRAEQVKASGLPDDDLRRAYRYHHDRIAKQFAPAAAPAAPPPSH